jgi:alkanesulfonate monooxygenase SsuD/methylene tetrahydromethanopterin reductase-like flavin-dependent oxidoreductase (luciferase family)
MEDSRGTWSPATLIVLRKPWARLKQQRTIGDMKKRMNSWIWCTRTFACCTGDAHADVKQRLWEGSWEDGAKIFDRERGIAYDYEKAHRVKFEGNFHNTDTWAPMHPSPQRTPVIFQAGASKAGSDFAAKHAEAIFGGTNQAKETGKFVRRMRDLAAANGRDPNHIKFFPGITPIVAPTVEEAQRKYEIALANVDYRGGLAKFSSYLGIDLSKYPLDEPFDTSLKEINGVQTMLNLLTEDPNKRWTPRQIGAQMAFCGFGPMPCGTPDMVADVFEEWINDGDIDGFNVACRFPWSENLDHSTDKRPQMSPTLPATRTWSNSWYQSYKSEVLCGRTIMYLVVHSGRIF